MRKSFIMKRKIYLQPLGKTTLRIIELTSTEGNLKIV